jgi:hypothetical protein
MTKNRKDEFDLKNYKKQSDLNTYIDKQLLKEKRMKESLLINLILMGTAFSFILLFLILI